MSIRTAVLWIAFVGSAASQGAGTVASNGFEPRVSLSGLAAGHMATLTVDRLVPGAAPGLLVALSPQPGSVPLAALGMPGAVLGIDLATAWTFPWLPVPAGGRVDIPFFVIPELVGVTLYVQAINVGPPEVPGGPPAIALSDAEVFTFGWTLETALVSYGPSVSEQGLQQLFTDGLVQGPTLPALADIEVMDVELASCRDTFAASFAYPTEDRSVPDRPRIRLPELGSLYRYRTAAGREGLFVAGDQDGSFRPLIEVSVEIDSLLAASPFEPLICVKTRQPAAEWGGAQVFLVRTDGENHVGLASPVSPVALGPGADVSVESLTFLDGALLLVDAASGSLWRAPTDLSAAAAPVPLAGVIATGNPVADEEIAWARNGSKAAVLIGDPGERDVFMVAVTGPAMNATQDPDNYASVGYGSASSGGLLAVSPDGSRIAYVVQSGSGNDGELYVQDIAAGSGRVQVTGNDHFEPYIDVETPIFFALADRLVFPAGETINTQDLYVVQLAGGQVAGVTNVTGSSGVVTPPFQQGSTLSILDVAQTDSGGVLFRMQGGPNGGCVAGLLDPAGAPSVIIDGIANLVTTQVTAAGAMMAVNGASSRVVLFTPHGAATLLTASSGTLVTHLACDPWTGSVVTFLRQGVLEYPCLISSVGVSTPLPGLGAVGLSRSTRFLASGSLILGRVVGGVTDLTRLDISGTSAESVIQLPGVIHLY